MATFSLPTSSTADPLNVVIVTTGSVASIKLPLIVEALLKHDRVQVQVIATKASLTFYSVEEVEKASSGKVKVWQDEDEWTSWTKMGDQILHIELRRWASLVLIAPCSANSLAKIVAGICDNLATSFLRALDPATPTYLFPAMNTYMYAHPLTARHLQVVQEELGYVVSGPVGKNLACGDVGVGAMTEWTDIVKIVEQRHLAPAATTVASLTRSMAQSSLSSSSFSPFRPATIISDSPVQPPPPPRQPQTLSELETFLQSRHPMTLPSTLLNSLLSSGIFPSTLVHRPIPEAAPPRDGEDELRRFFFIPERLSERHLEGLDEAVRQDQERRARSEAEGRKEKPLLAEEVEARRWLLERFSG